MADKPTKPPKVFISYSWEDDVKTWVRNFAKQLRKDGIDAVLDQWETHHGDQLPEFMEKAVRGSDFVIVLCTPKYKRKSDNREGGVGYEGHVITSEILQNSSHRKFIPVLRKGTWGTALPSWAMGKLSIDLSGDPYSKENYQDLLRTLHGKRYTPPPVGTPPDFPDDDDGKPPTGKPFISKKVINKFQTSVRDSTGKLVPLLRIAGILVVIGALFWVGSWAISKFPPQALISTASLTPTYRPSPTFTFTPPPPTKTLTPKPTSTKTQTPTPLPTQITDAKGVSMVLVPAGEFIMGRYAAENKEMPAHKVYLDAFYMDIYEITNARYIAFLNAGARPTIGIRSGYPDFPVNTTWYESDEYCKWRGARLPTEAEWEKAARGTDDRTYPWGEGIDCSYANYWKCRGSTTEVGSYEKGKSPYGIYDMAGNLAEWVADWFSDNYYNISPFANPLGPQTGDQKVRRGGSWYFSEDSLRVSSRFGNYPDMGVDAFGFRCARSP